MYPDVERLAGQLLMGTLPGKELNETTKEAIRAGRIGGLLFFPRNLGRPEEIKALLDEIQALAMSSQGRPLLLAVDQEGGIANQIGEGWPISPGNMALGATAEPQWAYQAALASGQFLRSLGFQFNFAPVVDLQNNPNNPIIGARSFGDDPHLAGEMAAWAIRGYRDAGVLSSAKHFPGHGDTAFDSHLGLPTIPHPIERLRKMEWVPFRAAIAADVPAIMSAHIAFPALEPTPGLPATLSKKILQGILRQELGFEGLIVSDLMSMHAISHNFGVVQASVRAVEAGIDLLLLADNPDLQRQTWEALVQAGQTQPEVARRIQESASKTLRFKAEVETPVTPRVTREEAEKIMLGAARDSVHVEGDLSWREGLQKAERVLVVSLRSGTNLPLESLAQYDQMILEHYQSKDVSILVNPQSGSDLIEKAAGADQILVLLCQRGPAPAEQLAVLDDLLGVNPQTLVVSLSNPYLLHQRPALPWVAFTYGYAPVSILALLEVLDGAEPRGKAPVRLRP